MAITPVQYGDNPPEHTDVPYALEAEAHRIQVAAERLAGLREVIRAEGEAVEVLERVETHLVWAIDQLGAEAARLREAGWRPPEPPRPEPRTR